MILTSPTKRTEITIPEKTKARSNTGLLFFRDFIFIAFIGSVRQIKPLVPARSVYLRFVFISLYSVGVIL